MRQGYREKQCMNSIEKCQELGVIAKIMYVFHYNELN